MGFHLKDEHYSFTLVTGPNYVNLWLALVDAERDAAPDVVQVKYPRCPDIDPNEVRVAVMAGVDEANAKFGTRLNPLEIKFIIERPEPHLLQTAAFKIIERLVTVGDAAYTPPDVQTKRGKIIEILHGLQIKVRFEDGEEVDAVIPKRVARLAFKVCLGDEVDVTFKEPPKMARVVRLWHSGRRVA